MNIAKVLAVLILPAVLPPGSWAGEIRVLTRDKIVLQVRTPTATQVEPPEQGFVGLDVDPDTGAEATVRLLWPDAEESLLKLSALEKRCPDGGRRIDLQAELRLPDGSRVRSKRWIPANHDTTALFEVYRVGSRALILTIDSELVEETIIPGLRATPGHDVLFLVEVQRVIEGRVISLERNQLHSFIGEPVTYSFSLGDTADADSVRLELRAARTMQDLIEIDVGVSGSLPGEGGPQRVSRGEQWMSTRGTASTVAVESGDPPTGYRFVVTPIF